MKKGFIIFILTFITIAVYAGIINLNNPFTPINPFTAPDTATNHQIYSFSNIYAANTPILLIGIARCGNGNTDTLYSGTFNTLVFEDNPDASVFTFNLAGTDTTDVFDIVNGECYFYIENPDTEMIALRIADTTGNIKHSFFSIMEFREKTDTATCMKGFEDSVMQVDFPGSMFIRVEDDSSRIFPDYASLMTDSTMKIKILNPDPDFVVASLGRQSSDSIFPLIINGGYYIQFGPQTIGSFDVVFEPLLASPPVPPETIHIEVLPPEESPLFIAFSADGYNQTEGKDRTLLLMNMGDDGPRSTNNTSEVLTEIFDLSQMGATLTPAGVQTLTSGTAQVGIECDSVNECIVIKITTQGTPQLENITKYIPLEFKHRGIYTNGKAIGPNIAVMGDTIEFTIIVTDAYDSLDYSYKGFGNLSEGPMDLEIINAYSDFIDRYPEIDAGAGHFRLSFPFEDTTSIYFTDGEGNFTNNYYATSGFDGQEIITVWKPGTGSSAAYYETFMPDNNMFLVNELEFFSIAAMVDDSIAASYNDFALLTHSGTGFQAVDTVDFIDGVATINVKDSIAESVELTISDGTLSITDTLHFMADNEAAFIVVAGPKTNLAAEDYTLTFFAMTGGFTMDTTYNGTLTILYEDTTGDTNSFYCYEDITSIALVNGTANVDFSNSDIERISISGYSVSGSDTLLMENTDLVTTGYVHPVYNPVIEHPEDTIYIHILDIDSSIVAYSTEIDSLVINEAIDDSSFEIIGDTCHIAVTDGVALIRVTDSSEETVRIYGEYYDEFLQDNYTYKLLFQFNTHNGIVNTGNAPAAFYLQTDGSLFEDNYTFRFGVPASENVRLTIYDKTGRMIKRLADGTYMPGHYVSIWDGTDLNGKSVPAGTYFGYIRTDSKLRSNKIIVVK